MSSEAEGEIKENSGFNLDISNDEMRRKALELINKEESIDVIDIKTKTYDKRKTIAHGMMDTALISANASQLKFIIQYYKNRDTVTLTILVTLIVLSLTIQIAVGIALIFKHKKKDKTAPTKVTSGINISIEDSIVSCLFLVIILNIFIAAFSTEMPEQK